MKAGSSGGATANMTSKSHSVKAKATHVAHSYTGGGAVKVTKKQSVSVAYGRDSVKYTQTQSTTMEVKYGYAGRARCRASSQCMTPPVSPSRAAARRLDEPALPPRLSPMVKLQKPHVPARDQRPAVAETQKAGRTSEGSTQTQSASMGYSFVGGGAMQFMESTYDASWSDSRSGRGGGGKGKAVAPPAYTKPPKEHWVWCMK